MVPYTWYPPCSVVKKILCSIVIVFAWSTVAVHCKIVYQIKKISVPCCKQANKKLMYLVM